MSLFYQEYSKYVLLARLRCEGWRSGEPEDVRFISRVSLWTILLFPSARRISPSIFTVIPRYSKQYITSVLETVSLSNLRVNKKYR